MPTKIHIFGFDQDNIEEADIRTAGEAETFLKKWPMVWIDVSGLGDSKLVGELGRLLALHPLALEDVLHVPQRAKYETYEGNIFIIVPMVEVEGGVPVLDQLSLFLGKNFVLTFQERPGDVFGNVRERLRKGQRVRMAHADYLAYALLDAVVDGYFPILENYGARLDELEENLLERTDDKSMREIHQIKRELHSLRLCIWPTRDALAKVSTESGIISQETRLFFRDCQDHIIQILDITENYRERLSSFFDLYVSSVNNKLNEVIKVLTMIATIFMPLSFIASLYGMNFNTSKPLNMPELNSPYGYPMVLLFMAIVAGGMIYYFYRKGWFRSDHKI